jgi:hypothetical protein
VDQIPVFVSPSDRVAQLYPQASDTLSVDFYDSHSYGRVIIIRPNKGKSEKEKFLFIF